MSDQNRQSVLALVAPHVRAMAAAKGREEGFAAIQEMAKEVGVSSTLLLCTSMCADLIKHLPDGVKREWFAAAPESARPFVKTVELLLAESGPAAAHAYLDSLSPMESTVTADVVTTFIGEAGAEVLGILSLTEKSLADGDPEGDAA